MPWPSSKATTTHLDAQTDDPNQARPQIKQNIDNVNDIIDFFPSGLISFANQFVILELGNDGSGPTSGGSTQFNTVTELSDTGSLCTLGTVAGKGSVFVLASGTYLVNCNGPVTPSDGTGHKILNHTQSSTLVTAMVPEVGTTGFSIGTGIDNSIITSNGSDQLALQFLGSGGVDAPNYLNGFKIRFTKLT